MAGETDIISSIGTGTTGTIEAIAGSLMYYDAMQAVDDLDRPNYEIPDEIRQLVDLYSKEYKMSGQPLSWEYGARARQKESTSRSVSQSMEASTSAADLLGSVSSSYSQERRALADLEIEAARQKESNKQMFSQLYGKALETSAQYKDKAFNWNEAMKYQEEYNKLMGLAETGYETWQMGADTISESFSSMSSTDMLDSK